MIRCDEKKILKKMNQYSLIVGKEVSQLVRNGARLQCIELMNFTWPLSQLHGNKRIAKDVSKIFTALNPKWWKVAMEKKTIVTKNKTIVSPGQQMISDLEGAKTFHKANRVFMKGKELPLDRKAVIKISARRKLLVELKQKVALCKAGWAVAASLCKADVRQPLRGVPKWVKRNVAKAVGSVREVKLTGMGFRIDTTNKIDYTSELLKKKYQDIARNIARDKFVKMMSSAIRATKLKEAGLK
jgi:hypothetical protein